MDKRIIMTATAVLVALGAYLGANKLVTHTELSDLQLANIEALADDDEKDGDACYNDIHAKDGSMVRYCPVCDYVPGTDDFFCLSKTCKKKI